jgi:ABC-type branched-subunit amino acid transport system ATPase component/branched-subunit amino acid ABC-type transport system permease component
MKKCLDMRNFASRTSASAPKCCADVLIECTESAMLPGVSSVVEYAVLSLGAGGVYAWVALGTVVIQRGAGVLNFAQGALLMFSAYAFNDLRGSWGVWPAAALAVLLVSGISLATYALVMRPLRKAAPLTRTVATLGLLVILQATAVLLFGTGSKPTAPVLPDGSASVLGTTIGQDRLYIVGAALALTVVLWALFRFTTVGLAVTAAAENPRAASTLGWSADLFAAGSWCAGGAIAGVAGIITAPTQGPLSATNLILLVVPGLAAAVVGSFRSFPVVFLGALGLALLELETRVQLSSRYGWLQGLEKAVPLAVVVGVLAGRGSSIPERGHQAEERPELGSGRVHVPALLVALAAVGAGLLTFFSVGWTNALTANLGWAIVMLSVVVLVGYTGQLSLGQLAFSGVAALIAGRLVATTGVPFWLALLLGVAGTIPIGLLFALPALRTRGLNLAVVTLSLAVAVEQIAFKRGYTSPTPGDAKDAGLLGAFTKNTEGTVVQGHVSLFGIDLDRIEHPTSYAFFALACFVLSALAVANLRRSRAGRRLIAVRTNERAAASLGISVVGAKLYAFGLSAALAGLGGIVLAFQQRNLGFGSGEYDPFRSVLVVAFAVVGGVGYVSGAFLGAQLMPATLGAAASRALSDGLVKLGGGLRVVAALLTGLLGIPIGRAVGRPAPRARWAGLVVCAGLGIVFATQISTWLRELDRYLPLVGGVVLILLLVQNAGGMASGTRRTFGGLSDRSSPGRPVDAFPAGDTAHERVTPGSLTVQGLTVRFGAVVAVDDVSFSVRPGQIVGLIGPNGAGKTTVVDAITGYNHIAAGTITLQGRPLSGAPAHKRARGGLSRSFQNLELFEDLTVLENIRAASDPRDLAAYLTGLVKPGGGPLSAAATAAIREFGLEGDLHRRVSDLAYGRRRLVAIARAVASSPSVLLLDEPAAGLDEGESRELASLVRRLCDEWGLAILLIEHDMAFVMGVSDHVVVLDFGRKIAEGTPEQTQRDPAVLRAYLGDPDEQAEALSGAGVLS